MTFDRSRSLDELEGDVWGDPEFASFLVTRCHTLRKKPVGDFSIEDLRIMIGQQIGLGFLVPLALEVLESNPLAEGDFYPGDLLSIVLRIPGQFWRQQPDLRKQVIELMRGVDSPSRRGVTGSNLLLQRGAVTTRWTLWRVARRYEHTAIVVAVANRRTVEPPAEGERRVVMYRFRR